MALPNVCNPCQVLTEEDIHPFTLHPGTCTFEEFSFAIPNHQDSTNQSIRYPLQNIIFEDPSSSLQQPMNVPMSKYVLPVNSLGDGTPVPQLRNIVSTVNLGCALNLKQIVRCSWNTEYNPKHSSAVIMRIRRPRTTALIYASGKLICTGAETEKDSRVACRKFARLVQKLGFPVKFLDFKIQNMMACCNVRFTIHLEELVRAHGNFSSYEPELFRGVIYRMPKPRIVLQIFSNGKIILTGGKVRADIVKAFDTIYPILKTFQKH